MFCSGIEIDGRINQETNKRVIVQGNQISNLRAVGISVSREHQPFSSGVVLKDNEMCDSRDREDLISAEVKSCVSAGKCSRNVTGKSYAMQSAFVCEQCDLDLECLLCLACALNCHKGHRGVVVESVVAEAFCDCPEHGCVIFDGDPRPEM